eukprot:2271-Heterococcus_DN1.PRE.5
MEAALLLKGGVPNNMMQCELLLLLFVHTESYCSAPLHACTVVTQASVTQASIIQASVTTVQRYINGLTCACSALSRSYSSSAFLRRVLSVKPNLKNALLNSAPFTVPSPSLSNKCMIAPSSGGLTLSLNTRDSCCCTVTIYVSEAAACL